MGHLRPRAFPRTQRWRDVVGLIEAGASLKSVADASLEAATTGLGQIPRDPGFLLVLAGIFRFADGLRSKDPVRALNDEGFHTNQLSTMLGYTTSLREKIDLDLTRTRARSDLSELALNSISEALSRQTTAAAPSLFVRSAVGRFCPTVSLCGQAVRRRHLTALKWEQTVPRTVIPVKTGNQLGWQEHESRG
jgi:hypothetical protein